ncbi:hypothetical protein Bache_1606 [Bacteroides helcogenes P 36-108]|uniref:Uncharacterized protein n=1 Tax=Bacteroides helcogenes (strain ATCC 35417 / DSM 20613 / JCM 6297 / CCUG 15421 / P 36-108) TaxID=693979 RepID=E6SWQ8_BACT6|nr:hypothetical protein Bache_1606 [Bacteroides helcogenes P 36-108]
MISNVKITVSANKLYTMIYLLFNIAATLNNSIQLFFNTKISLSTLSYGNP